MPLYVVVPGGSKGVTVGDLFEAVPVKKPMALLGLAAFIVAVVFVAKKLPVVGPKL